MIRIDNPGQIAEFRRQMKLEMARLDREISTVFFKWTRRIFYELVANSPQWSGNMAANWNYSVNGPDFSYTQIPNKTGDGKFSWAGNNGGVFERGHQFALLIAMQRMETVAKPTWRDKVFFTNVTPMDDREDDLVDYLERNPNKVRPVNLVDGKVVLIDQTVIRESQRTEP